jgi:hypothetical protein
VSGGHSRFARRHYNAVAALLRENQPTADDVAPGELWGMIRDSFSRMFMRDNPRFDRFRFEDACEYTPKGVKKADYAELRSE